MKNFLTLCFCLFIVSSYAQQALLKFDNGTAQEAYILEIDSTRLTTSDGEYRFNEIEEISFPDRKGRYEHLYFELNRAGVKVSFDKNLELTVMRPPYSNTPAGELAQFRDSFSQYKRSHQIGTGLQLAGVMLGAIGLVLESNGVVYAGMATAATGLVVEIGAANKVD